MKKVLLATAMTMALGIASGSALATDVEGGQINFHGLVSAPTCDTTVTSSHGSSATDGDVYLNTVAPADITGAVSATAPGAEPEPFSIVIDCSKSGPVAEGAKASLTMASTFADTTGTLNNDENVTVNGVAAATGVDIAIHNADNNTAQVKVDGQDAQIAQFVDDKATYNFIASYVLSNAGKTPTSGIVTTNAMYTFTYQ
ncbi:TPA: fimbrial protein [Salmonella enterica]|nr:fimbrial protein [Salmonella enterica]